MCSQSKGIGSADISASTYDKIRTIPARLHCASHRREALVGFQGRGCVDGVQPDFYPSLLLGGPYFSIALKMRYVSRTTREPKTPESHKSNREKLSGVSSRRPYRHSPPLPCSDTPCSHTHRQNTLPPRGCTCDRPHARIARRPPPLPHTRSTRRMLHSPVSLMAYRQTHMSLFRFMVHYASEARRPRDGWWTVHWPAVPLAFLESTGMRPWMSSSTSFPPLRPRRKQMACGCTLHHVRMPLHAVNRWLNRDKLNPPWNQVVATLVLQDVPSWSNGAKSSVHYRPRGADCPAWVKWRTGCALCASAQPRSAVNRTRALRSPHRARPCRAVHARLEICMSQSISRGSA